MAHHSIVATSRPTPTNSMKTTHSVKRINAKKPSCRTIENPMQDTKQQYNGIFEFFEILNPHSEPVCNSGKVTVSIQTKYVLFCIDLPESQMLKITRKAGSSLAH